MEDKYVVEYSGKQKCFHIDSLKRTLERNQKDFKKGIFENDYKIIEICSNYVTAICIKKIYENTFLK